MKYATSSKQLIVILLLVIVSSCSKEEMDDTEKKALSQAVGVGLIFNPDIREPDFPDMKSNVPGTNLYTIKVYKNEALIHTNKGKASYRLSDGFFRIFYEYKHLVLTWGPLYKGDIIRYEIEFNSFARLALGAYMFKIKEGHEGENTNELSVDDFPFFKSTSAQSTFCAPGSMICMIKNSTARYSYAEDINNLDRFFEIEILIDK